MLDRFSDLFPFFRFRIRYPIRSSHRPWWRFELLDLIHHICQRTNLSSLLLSAEAEVIQEQCPFQQLDAEGGVNAFGAGL